MTGNRNDQSSSPDGERDEESLSPHDVAQARAMLAAVLSTQPGKGVQAGPGIVIDTLALIDAVLVAPDPRASALSIVSDTLSEQTRES